MTTRADILNLADRVEREEPNRELDASIARSLGWTQNDPRDADDFTGWTDPARPGRVVLPRHWTTSLDAAASLVPEGALVSVEQNASGWECCVTLLTGRFLISQDEEWYGIAPTEPRARTAAALRARAQEIADDR